MEMNVSGINRVTQTLLEQTFGTGQVEAQRELEEAQRIVGGFQDVITISEVGRNINELYSELRVEGSEEAMAGFREMVIEMAESPDPAEALRFVQTAERLEESGEVFRESFEVAFELQGEDLETREWFGNIREMDAGEADSYLEVTRGLISSVEAGDDVALGAAFRRFVGTVSAITESEDLSEDEQQVYLRQLLDEVGELSDLGTIYDYLDAFRGEVL